MFSRLLQVAKTIYQFVTGGVNNFFALPRPIISKDGMLKIEKIRPVISTWNRVLVVTDKFEPKQYQRLLKDVMTQDAPDARLSYSVINDLTSSNFFISMSGQKARQLRDKLVRAIRLNVSDVSEATSNTIAAMLLYLRHQVKVNSEVEIKINHEIRGLITRAMTGLELTPRMHALLDKDINSPALGFGFLPAIPYFLRLLSSQFREHKSEFDVAIREFLQNEFSRIAKTDCTQESLLLLIVREKFPTGSLAALLSDEKIVNQLIEDRDIRLCISGALSSANLAPVIRYGMLSLSHNTNMHAPRQSHGQLICRELQALRDSGIKLTDDVILNQKQLPYLHAYWLEVLRYYPPMAGVVRMSNDELTVGNVTIPDKSVCYVTFHPHAVIEGDTFDADRFEPLRHINQPDTLHQGFFTPFGLGPRMCPATKIAALIFKKFIAGMAVNIVECSYEKIQFTSAENLSVLTEQSGYRNK